MLKNASGAGEFTIGLLSAIPSAAGAIAMVIVGRNSDRTGERRLHLIFSALLSATGVVLSTFGSSTAWVVFTLSLATAGYASMFRPVLGSRHGVDAWRWRRRRDRPDQLGRQYRRSGGYGEKL